MHGKLLIVDAIPTSRIALKVKLAAAFYDVETTPDMAGALKLLQTQQIDLVICGRNLVDGDAVRLVRRMALLKLGEGVPVLASGTDIDSAKRLALLEAGVADILDPAWSDARLLATVRGLIRAYGAEAEWAVQSDAAPALGLAEAPVAFQAKPRIALVARSEDTAADWMAQMQTRCAAHYSRASLRSAMARVADAADAPDIFVLALCAEHEDTTLAVLAAIRAHRATRHCAVLIVEDGWGDDGAVARALDLGADRVMPGGFDAAEIHLRLRHLVARKRRIDQWRSTMRSGVEAALIDPLTGLRNRRYALPHLARVIHRARGSGRPFAVMIADLDHFKSVNDRYGHSAGDAVLVQTAARLQDDLRPVDMIARIGGEEFLVVMPGIGLHGARGAARRLCSRISQTPFSLQNGQDLHATISIGIAVGTPGGLTGTADEGQRLIDQADRALYNAKVDGRNRVRMVKPAA